MSVTAEVAKRMWRIEVRPSEAAGDPRGASVRREAAHVGVHPTGVRSARVYLISGPLTEDQAERLRTGLLTDPVLERSVLGSTEARAGERVIEVHPLPGVMDPAAQTVRDAAAELTGVEDLEVVTGRRYDVSGVTAEEADRLATGLLSNAVVEQVHHAPWTPERLPEAAAADQRVRHVEIRDLDDAGLERLSRDGHLFLSTRRDARDPRRVPPAGARAHRHRARDARADVERALRPQDAQEHRPVHAAWTRGT
jgi:phosphoribosylformylglycinamidine (FGAM) synthase PurS component